MRRISTSFAVAPLLVGLLAAAPSIGHAATGPTELPGFVRATLSMPSSDTSPAHYFGSPLAISGNTLATVDQTDGDGGAVFVYTRNSRSGSWSKPAVLTPPSSAALDNSEHVAIALSGPTLAVGEMSYGPTSATVAGIVYLYDEPAGGWKTTSTPSATVNTPTHETSGSEFGYAVALSAADLVVGAPGVETPDLMSADGGAAYVYRTPGHGWHGTITSDPAELRSSPDGALDSFGNSVGISGDTVAVAAPYHEVSGKTEAGTGYVFVKPAGGWTGTITTARKLVASDVDTDMYLGADPGPREPETGLAISGNTVVMSVYGASADSGAAYVYQEPAAGWLAASSLLTENARLGPPAGSNASTGRGVAAAGNTVMVGAFVGGYGTAYLYSRPHSGWSGTVAAPYALRSPAPAGCLQAQTLSTTAVALGAPCNNKVYVYAPPPPPAPSISKLAVHPKKWTLGPKATKVNFAHKPSHGTVISFTVSQAATVTLAFTAHSHFTVHAKAGANKVWFDGMLTAHHHLKHGDYHLRASVKNANGHTSDPHSVTTKAKKKSHK